METLRQIPDGSLDDIYFPGSNPVDFKGFNIKEESIDETTIERDNDIVVILEILQKKIRAFLEDFVTHMEQEEAVFQPLLDLNFEPQELKQMNEKVSNLTLESFCFTNAPLRLCDFVVKCVHFLQVLEQHTFYREKIKEKNLKAFKRKLFQ